MIADCFDFRNAFLVLCLKVGIVGKERAAEDVQLTVPVVEDDTVFREHETCIAATRTFFFTGFAFDFLTERINAIVSKISDHAPEKSRGFYIHVMEP